MSETLRMFFHILTHVNYLHRKICCVNPSAIYRKKAKGEHGTPRETQREHQFGKTGVRADVCGDVSLFLVAADLRSRRYFDTLSDT